MKYLVIGLGSMGKRRVRCLRSLGKIDIVGFDIRADRRREAEADYGIRTFERIESALEASPGAFIISVPPDLHHVYIRIAIARKIPFFVEASVLDTDLEEFDHLLRESDIVAVPSSTLLFHPAIRAIWEIVKKGELGKISNLILHSGQYLPDWHTYERVSDYYVSNPLTGGAREIVPFELTWLTHVFGFPRRVSANFRKTIEIEGASKIDDTYNLLLDYGSHLACLTVDVVSRYATRRLLINGENGQLIWSWDTPEIRIFSSETGKWESRPYQMQTAAAGYNENIGENMYIDEVKDFLESIEGKQTAKNTLTHDRRVLSVLFAAEKSDRTGKFVEI